MNGNTLEIFKDDGYIDGNRRTASRPHHGEVWQYPIISTVAQMDMSMGSVGDEFQPKD